MRASGGGIGLVGVVIIIGALYFTGAGSWMMNGLSGLSQNCATMIPNFAASIGYPVCGGVSKGVEFTDDATTRVGNFIRSIEEQFSSGARFGSLSELNESLKYAVADLASPKDALNQMISRGPQQLMGGKISQQFQQAVDSFTIGQFYVNRGGLADALPWLQQSAHQPNGFGVMSQLSLGDIYSRGGAGIQPDPRQAQAYYQMASQSLTQLNASNTPQAQQMLGTLPASPQEIQRQIQQTIAQLKRR